MPVELHSTVDAARQIGVTYAALQQLMLKRIIPKPEQRFGPSYVWTDREIEAARVLLAAHKADKKKPAENG